MSATRMCQRNFCKTRISRYNPGPYCWNHTPPELIRAHGNGRSGRMSAVDQLQLLEGGGRMSDRFLTGVADVLSDEDRALIASGEWVGVTQG